LLARKQLTLPPRTRADIQRLLYLTYPVTCLPQGFARMHDERLWHGAQPI
jgi:hypothetical protein